MNIEYRRVNHVTVAVPAGEHEKVRAFYGGMLGLTEVTSPAALGGAYDILWFQWLDILLHIDFTPPWVKPAENRHVAVEVRQNSSLKYDLERGGRNSAKPWSFQIANVSTSWIRLETISNSSK